MCWRSLTTTLQIPIDLQIFELQTFVLRESVSFTSNPSFSSFLSLLHPPHSIFFEIVRIYACLSCAIAHFPAFRTSIAHLVLPPLFHGMIVACCVNFTALETYWLDPLIRTHSYSSNAQIYSRIILRTPLHFPMTYCELTWILVGFSSLPRRNWESWWYRVCTIPNLLNLD